MNSIKTPNDPKINKKYSHHRVGTFVVSAGRFHKSDSFPPLKIVFYTVGQILENGVYLIKQILHLIIYIYFQQLNAYPCSIFHVRYLI